MVQKQFLSLIFAAGFLLGVYEGKIALWKDGSNSPTVFPYRASLLPRDDRKKLEQGIRIENEDQLIQLLEDYLS